MNPRRGISRIVRSSVTQVHASGKSACRRLTARSGGGSQKEPSGVSRQSGLAVTSRPFGSSLPRGGFGPMTEIESGFAAVGSPSWN